MTKSIMVLAALLAGTACAKTTPSDPPPTEAREEAAMDPVETAVQFQAAGMTIHGTITRPAVDGRYPAIAIAAGSGPTDRDWRNPLIPGANGSGALLADALARQGVAVLRYDKRGTGATGMPTGAIAWGDYAAELGAATAVLADQPFVDPARIFVAGHSEGGVHALRVAAQPVVPLAGVMLLSAAGRSLRDIVLWQIGNQIQASGLNPAAAQAEIDALTAAIDTIAAGGTVDPASVGQLQGVQQFLMALQNPQSVAFARGLLTFDPLAAFATFDLPVLVLTGGRDIQVDPELDARPLAQAAQAAGRPTTFVLAEQADHVLKTEPTPRAELTPAVGLQYNAEGRRLDEDVVPAIVQFVQR